MARLNITIPDALYERLEELRDRINLSKVCANALEKEVAMLERQPNITDPRIAQLLKRLQGTRERWYQRGREDGIQWAVETATRDELQLVATTLAGHDGAQLQNLFRKHQIVTSAPPFMQATTAGPGMPMPPMPPMPPKLEQKFMVTQPVPPEAGAHMAFSHPPYPPHPPHPGHERATFYMQFDPHGPRPIFPASFNLLDRLQYWEKQEVLEQAGGQKTRIEVDEAAYLEGWRDAVKEIWQAIAPAL